MGDSHLPAAIQPGDAVRIAEEITIDGKLAFSYGERLVVERILPDEEWPEYRYVVYSVGLNERFHLSDHEVVSDHGGFSIPAPPSVAAPSKRWARPLAAVAAVVLVLAAFVAIFARVTGDNASGPEGPPAGGAEKVKSGKDMAETEPSTSMQGDEEGSEPREAAPSASSAPQWMTLDLFNRLRKGMTYEEVVSVVGNPGLSVADVAGYEAGVPAGYEAYVFFGDASSDFGVAATVVFQGGVLQDKYQQGLR